MASGTIDEFNIKITSEAQDAADSLTLLANALSGIKSNIGPATTALENLSTALSGFAKATANLNLGPVVSSMGSLFDILSTNRTAYASINGLADSLKRIGKVDVSGLSTAIGQTVDALGGISDTDISRLDRLANALTRISTAGGYGGIGGTITEAADAIKEVSATVGGTGENSFPAAFNTLQTVANGVKVTIRGISNAVSYLGKQFNFSSTLAGRFISSLARIAKYRFLRALIRGIISGTKEGLENLAHASAEVNANMSQLTSMFATLKNAAGAALYSALEPIIGVLVQIGNAAIKVFNYISMFFAIITGKSSFKQAVGIQQSFVDTTEKTSKATDKAKKSTDKLTDSVKKYKQELMGFDEINSLSPDDDTGGSGSGGSSPSSGTGSGSGAGGTDYGAMFKTVQVEDWFKQMVDSADFSELGKRLANKLNSALASIDWDKVKQTVWKVANSLATLINGFAENIDGKLLGRSIAMAINSAAFFANTFWNNTNWVLIGTKMHDALMEAVKTIDAGALATAIWGKLKSMALLLYVTMPKGDEWKLVAEKIRDFIVTSVDTIPWGTLGDIVAELIVGALTTMRILAESGTLTRIASGIKDFIERAIGTINGEELAETLTAVVRDALHAISVIASITITLTFGDNKWEFPAWAVAIATAGIGLAARKLFAAAIGGSLGGTALTAIGGQLAVTGGIIFAIQAFLRLAGKDGIIDDIKNGEFPSANKIAKMIGSTLVALKLFRAPSAMKTNFFGGAVGAVAAVGFGLSLDLTIDKIEGIRNNLQNGEGLNVDEVVDTVASAMKTAGLGAVAMGHTGLGAGLIAVSFAIEPVVNLVQNLKRDKSADTEMGHKAIMADLIKMAFATAGLVVGFITGGPVGGAIGFTVGIQIQPYVEKVLPTVVDANGLFSGQHDDLAAKYGHLGVIDTSWDDTSNTQIRQYLDDLKYQMDTGVGDLRIELETVDDIKTEYLSRYSSAAGEVTEGASDAVEQMYEIFKNFTGIEFSADGSSGAEKFEQFITEWYAGLEGVDADGATLSLYGMKKALYEFLSLGFENFDSGFVDSFTTFFSDTAEAAGYTTTALDELTESTEGVGELVDGIEDLTGAASDAVDEAVEAGESAKATIQGDGVGEEGATSMLSRIEDQSDDTTAGLKAAGEEAVTMADNIATIPTDVVVKLSFDGYQDMLDNISTLNSNIANLSGTVRLTVEAGLTWYTASFMNALQYMGGTISWAAGQLLRYRAFAKGGYPQAGQLYLANENGIGSELIGQIGNKHAVANDAQIGDAIFKYMDEHDRRNGDGSMNYDALAGAMVRAMKANGLGAVYLDGKKLADSINRESRRIGRSAVTY